MGSPSLIGRGLEEGLSFGPPGLSTGPLFFQFFLSTKEGVLSRAKNGPIAESGCSPVTVQSEFDSPKVLNAQSTVNFNDLLAFRVLSARLQPRQPRRW